MLSRPKVGQRIEDFVDSSFYASVGTPDVPRVTSRAGISRLDLSFVPRGVRKGLRVSRSEGGRLKLAFRSSGDVFDFYTALAGSEVGAEIDLEFDPALVGFEPPEGLLKKSKNPLWVMKPVDGKTVMIERLWERGS